MEVELEPNKTYTIFAATKYGEVSPFVLSVYCRKDFSLQEIPLNAPVFEP